MNNEDVLKEADAKKGHLYMASKRDSLNFWRTQWGKRDWRIGHSQKRLKGWGKRREKKPPEFVWMVGRIRIKKDNKKSKFDNSSKGLESVKSRNHLRPEKLFFEIVILFLT